MNFDSRAFNSPLSLDTADLLLSLLEPTPERSLLDVGCGRGELIYRWLAAGGGSAIGVDLHEGELALARMRDFEGATRAVWHLGKISDVELPAGIDVATCIGSGHAFCEETDLGPQRLRKALAALRALLKPGGLALVGEGFWKQSPHPDYLAATGMSAPEMQSHAENLAVCEEVGESVPFVLASSQEEWDRFEAGSLLAAERQFAADPENMDSVALLERRRSWRRSYLRWGREAFGFGFYLVQFE